MNISEITFLIQFLGTIALVGYFFYKVMSIGLSYIKKTELSSEYDVIKSFKFDFAGLALMLLSYAVGRITFMIAAGYGTNDETKLFYAGMMGIEGVLIRLGLMLFVVCIFQNIKDMATKQVGYYKATKRTLRGN